MGDNCDTRESLPRRRTSHLRTHRLSVPGERYFVTVVTRHRIRALADRTSAGRVVDTLMAMHAGGDFRLLAATVMPDHVHYLVELGMRLSLGRVFAKFKSLTRAGGRTAWEWQQEQFEHRVRPHEDVDDYGLYILLNPYRATLIDANAAWPWWVCPDPTRLRFSSAMLPGNRPRPEWFDRDDRLARELALRD